ncbi:MAG: phosphate ABC transporter permease subunit PstC [Candidatus Micrarchaeia archaeon]
MVGGRFERGIELFLKVVAFTSALSVFLILLFLFVEAYRIVFFVNPFDMLLGLEWQPTSENPRYGMLPLIAGSLLVTVCAMLISVPLSIATAIYLSEIAPWWLGEMLKPIIEILAGIPSVVIGFFALVVVAPAISSIFGVSSGLTALNGALMLAIMAVPTIESIAEDGIRAVPKGLREASLALGATKWQTIRNVVLPCAMPCITTGVLLGFGRVIGETMVVLMATGNAAMMPTSLLDPVRTMTATIAAEMGEVARGTPHYHSLFMLGFLLFVITLAINTMGNMISRRWGR